MTERFACVAGGTSGIGRDLVLALLDRGYSVTAIGKGQQHADELAALALDHRRLTIATVDLRMPAAAAEIIDGIRARTPHLDLLVNGAGTISAGGLQVETFDDWERVITSNLYPLFTLTKAALPLLRASLNPSVVSISSVCSLRPCNSLSYSVSKAGTDMFTKVLARELAPLGIRVNAVNPGVVRSNLQASAGLFETQEAYEKWLDQMRPNHPLGRIGETSDVISAILFLASEQASWITGAILSVDGGRAIA